MEILQVIFYIAFVIISIWLRLRSDNIFDVTVRGSGEYDYYLLQYQREYERRLEVWLKDNKIQNHLINNNIELKIYKDNEGKILFYCKERTNGKKQGKFFYVTGDDNHASTMWAIINMEFNKYSTYAQIKHFYTDLNQGYGTSGGTRYFYEPFWKKLPKMITNKEAQNEYCRMTVKTYPNGKKVIECSEIWGDRTFLINSNTRALYGILSEFSKRKNKFETYIELLSGYRYNPDCTIDEIDKNKAEESSQPEPQKIESKIKVENIESENPELPEEPKEIEKYNERNLDL